MQLALTDSHVKPLLWNVKTQAHPKTDMSTWSQNFWHPEPVLTVMKSPHECFRVQSYYPMRGTFEDCISEPLTSKPSYRVEIRVWSGRGKRQSSVTKARSLGQMLFQRYFQLYKLLQSLSLPNLLFSPMGKKSLEVGLLSNRLKLSTINKVERSHRETLINLRLLKQRHLKQWNSLGMS